MFSTLHLDANSVNNRILIILLHINGVREFEVFLCIVYDLNLMIVNNLLYIILIFLICTKIDPLLKTVHDNIITLVLL